jgi:hypothetical protein
MCSPESADALTSVSHRVGTAGIHVKNPQDGTIKDPIAKLRKPFREGSNQVVFVSQPTGLAILFSFQPAFVFKAD